MEILGVERHVWAWVIGIIFACLASIISFTHIYLTSLHTHHSKLRKYTLIIIGMVPVYAIAACLGLLFKSHTAYWDLIREFYESLTIYAFFFFLATYLGGRQHMAAIMGLKKTQQGHMIPCCCLPEWPMTSTFYPYTKICVMQYVPIKLIAASLTFIFSLTGLYHDGDFNPADAFIYIAFINNASQLVALYGLVLFYHALLEELTQIRPLIKFLSIKAIVFATFWQSVLLSILVSVDVIEETVSYSVDQASLGLQDFLICIEMFLMAIILFLAFPPKEFQNYTGPPLLSRLLTRQQGSISSINVQPDETDEINYKLEESRAAKDNSNLEEENEDGFNIVLHNIPRSTTELMERSINNHSESPPYSSALGERSNKPLDDMKVGLLAEATSLPVPEAGVKRKVSNPKHFTFNI